MNHSPWTPRTTVAAVVENNGHFLMVEEISDGRLVFNQPAGHLDEGESLTHAVARELLEETGRHFIPTALVGIYRWRNPQSGLTFVRFCFTGTVGERDPQRVLDEGIVDARWVSRQEIEARPERLRSPMVMRCIEDYAAGRRYPLDLLVEMG